MLNKVMLLGRLGEDVEMRYTSDGRPSTTVRVATEHAWRDKSGARQMETEWHTVVSWDALAEVVNALAHEGRLVYVEGRLHLAEVVAEQVKFLEPREEDKLAFPEESQPL